MIYQIIAFIGPIILTVAFFMVVRQRERLIGELAMARQTIAVLAAKAKAWDDLQARDSWPVGSLGRQIAERGSTSVAYQHLSAECDGCEDAPAPLQHHPV